MGRPGTVRMFATWALRGLAVAAAAGTVVVLAGKSSADHSLGNSCLGTCHALRSTLVVPGSRNILSTEVADSLYHGDWYCGSAGWKPAAPDNQPLDCSYCHGSAGDVAWEFSLAAGGRWATPSKNGSAHPVRVGSDNAAYDAKIRIFCNDCHNGDVAAPTGPDLTPSDTDLCAKLVPPPKTGGYPNHQGLVRGTALPGQNDIAANPPRLTITYGTTVNWNTTMSGSKTGSNPMLCFVCHDGDSNTDPDFAAARGMTESTTLPAYSNTAVPLSAQNIALEYNAPGGGHNVNGVGSFQGKMPCYDCHDPHAAAGTATTPQEDNHALIMNGADKLQPGNYTDPYKTTNFSANSYRRDNDRLVCYGCHLASNNFTVKDSTGTARTPTNPADAANVKFEFHKNVHSGVGTDQCLSKNGGCHQSPHMMDIFRCLDCHGPNGPGHAKLANLKHVGNDFALGIPGSSPSDAAIKSRHDIAYDTSKDMSNPANNGCLYCHNVPYGATAVGSNIPLVSGYGGSYYGRPSSGWTLRENLKHYDAFCISCHNGSGPSFVPGASTYPPPQVGKYFNTSGHGVGLVGAETFLAPSTNGQAKIPCLECHVYHGSTAYKLLPGNVQATNNQGTALEARVVKGFTYTYAGTPAFKPTSILFYIGNDTDSRKIDYLDYTDPANNSRLTVGGEMDKFKSDYLSNYTAAWSTYGDVGSNPPTPEGTLTPFGTSGDMRDNSKNPSEASSVSLNCGLDATSASATGKPKIGFCNVCHFYSDPTNGTTSTYGRIYTHEGVPGGLDCNNNPTNSKNSFFKDCAECHDPHGSGTGTGTSDSDNNRFMIRAKMVRDDNTWKNVAFTASTTTGCNSFDSGSAVCSPPTTRDNHICSTCHRSDTASAAGRPYVKYHYSMGNPTPPPGHEEGKNCIRCHKHGQ